MANYVENRVICTQDFFKRFFMDDNPYGDHSYYKVYEDVKCMNNWEKIHFNITITFNKLYGCKSIDEYREETKCTTIDYVSGTIHRILENGMYEVFFSTRWYYPIKAIVKACELAKDELVWYAIEENSIYYSRFQWKNNQVEEDTLYIELTEEYEKWYDKFWNEIDSMPEDEYPEYWIWGYKPEDKDGWVNWPCKDLVERYLNYYPAGEYYEEMRGRK